MTAKRRSRDERRQEPNELDKRKRRIGLTFFAANGAIVCLKLLIRWFFLWKLFDRGMRTVQTLALEDKLGPLTDSLARVLSPENVKEWIEIGGPFIGIFGIAFGMIQRSMRKRSSQELERLVDRFNGEDKDDADGEG